MVPPEFPNAQFLQVVLEPTLSVRLSTAPVGIIVVSHSHPSRACTKFHTDYSVQYGGGILGPIIINGPSTANWDIDVGALPLTDWYHTPIFTAETREQHSTGPLTADNALVNGTMVAASGGTGGSYAVTTVTPGKKHLLRIVNTGINQYFRVSIDSHTMQVIAADFTPIKPYNTSSVTLAIGKSAESPNAPY
jgi:FtsP/CotA-like multicopper oxidase with cupredoxin domain